MHHYVKMSFIGSFNGTWLGGGLELLPQRPAVKLPEVIARLGNRRGLERLVLEALEPHNDVEVEGFLDRSQETLATPSIPRSGRLPFDLR
jgi:hypothetical protein